MKNKDELSLEMMKKEVLEITNLSFKQGQASRQAEIYQEILDKMIKGHLSWVGLIDWLNKQILEEKKAMKGVCKIITKQKTIKCFRWVTKDMKSEHGNMKWELGKWNKIDCKLLMCNSGLHAYTDSFDSMNNVFGDKWFISEARGVIKDKDSTKICCSEMRLIKEIPEMAWKRFALFCAKDCLKFYDKEYPSDKRVSDCIKAAEDFLDGKIDEIKLEKHRSAAGSAARSAARSAELAESAWSAWSAESAARSAGSATKSAWSAARSAESAVRSAELAESAWSARSAGSATRSAAEKRQEKELNRLLKEYVK